MAGCRRKIDAVTAATSEQFSSPPAPRAGRCPARSSGRCSQSSAAPGASRPSPRLGATPLPFGEGAGAEIFCFWHQCVLPCTFYFRRTGATIIVSQSFDGELIARTLGLFGYKTVRGSSSRGAQRSTARPQGGHRIRPPRHLHRRRPARPDFPNQVRPRPARRSHRRAHRRIPSRASTRLVAQFLGSLSCSHALHAHRRQLVSLDPRSPRPRRRQDSKKSANSSTAAIERARLHALNHFGKRLSMSEPSPPKTEERGAPVR